MRLPQLILFLLSFNLQPGIVDSYYRQLFNYNYRLYNRDTDREL